MNDPAPGYHERVLASGSPLVNDGANPFQPTITFRPLSIGEVMILTSGGGAPTWRTIEPWDLPGYEPTPLPSYMELFE